MSENISSVNVNIHQNLRTLVAADWLHESVEFKYIIQPKGQSLLQQVGSFFNIQKKKTNNQVLGDNYADNIAKYLLVFPKMMLPSGKPARSDKNNVETAFKWFFEHNKYSWETVLAATIKYVDKYEQNNYKYMQTSQYFIRKQNSDKTWASELANCCSAYETGSDEEPTNTHYSEKVV